MGEQVPPKKGVLSLKTIGLTAWTSPFPKALAFPHASVITDEPTERKATCKPSEHVAQAEIQVASLF